MGSVIRDVTEVIIEGTNDLGETMAFEKPFHEVFDEFSVIDAKVAKHQERSDTENKHDMLLLQSHVAQYNNPLNFLTPILCRYHYYSNPCSRLHMCYGILLVRPVQQEA